MRMASDFFLDRLIEVSNGLIFATFGPGTFRFKNPYMSPRCFQLLRNLFLVCCCHHFPFRCWKSYPRSQLRYRNRCWLLKYRHQIDQCSSILPILEPVRVERACCLDYFAFRKISTFGQLLLPVE